MIAFGFVAAGVMHFARPELFLAIVPPYIPFPRAAVLISGAAEIALGTGVIFDSTRKLAGIGLLLLLLAVFPANVFMYQHAERFRSIPGWVLLARLPLQFALMALIYWSTLAWS